jgi:hypothetical protein
MAWDDPSPRTRSRPAHSGTSARPGYAPAAQPGYGPVPISAGRLLWCLLLAAIVFVSTAVGALRGLITWHGHAGHGSLFDLVLAVAIGLAAAVLAWRYLSRRPGGGGWMWLSGRRRSWDDSYPGTTYTDVVVAEVVAEVVVDAIGAVLD